VLMHHTLRWPGMSRDVEPRGAHRQSREALSVTQFSECSDEAGCTHEAFTQAQVPMYTSCMHVLLTTGRQHIDHDIVLVGARMGSGLYTSSWPEGAATARALPHAHLFYV
jgi:hypothetical protein